MAVDYNLIGTRIKKYRKDKHLTQEQLSKRLHVSVGYVSKMERGIEKPNLDMLSSLADNLDCDIANLVSESTISQTDYLDNEFRILLEKFSADEKRILYRLLEYYMLLTNKD
ncbi:MAG: helix-turn-helix domain-containing protein [Pseudobutyrivibrio sp.]|nr:helix-turn-helix domain-containing protein [Pseudobutyrivibrio sp.]